jgi:hypothetical protein
MQKSPQPTENHAFLFSKDPEVSFEGIRVGIHSTILRVVPEVASELPPTQMS